MLVNLSLSIPEHSPFDFENVQATAERLRTIAVELATFEGAGLKAGDGTAVFDDNGQPIGYWKVMQGSSLEAAESGGR